MLNFLYTAVSWVLLRWHQLLSAIGMDKDSGLTWALSIVLLVITARLLLFRFFIKQIHYQRHMQELQPQIQKLRAKYKNDRRQLQQEMMKLQQDQGFNPLSGCLPMLLQFPIFISLFHVLRHVANSAHRTDTYHLTLYSFSRSETLSAAKAKLFDAPLATSFHDAADKITSLGGSIGASRSVTIFLVIVSAAATFITQRQVMKNATTTPEGTAATIQKAMLYFIPVSVLFSGFIFPLGVLIYWFTSNLWTMLQQFYIYKYHPHVPANAVAAVAPSSAGTASKPAPGAKPVRNPRGNGDSAATGGKASSNGNSSGSANGSTNGSSVPRPGARPANRRPAQNRKKRR